jgi:putative DNA methylase
VTYKKKLIEVALPLGAINAESSRDKSIRNHPQAIHRWWARRPLAAARAVLWSSLVDDPSAHPDQFPTDEEQLIERKRLFGILERLVQWESVNSLSVMQEARDEIIKSCDGVTPKILDPFGGGGAIPLEALRLGVHSFTGDLNPVAVIIQRAMLEIPSRFAGMAPVNSETRMAQSIWEGTRGLASDVQFYGDWMQSEATKVLADSYPNATTSDGNSATPIAWVWARTVKSPDPSWPHDVPLVRSWILSKRPRKPVVWIEPMIDAQNGQIAYRVQHGGEPPEATVSRNGGICIATGTPIPLSYVRAEAQAGRMGSTLLAIVADGPNGRVYCDPSEQPLLDLPVEDEYVPKGKLPKKGLGFRVQNYGITEWHQLFTERQLSSLTVLASLLKKVRSRVEQDAVTFIQSDNRRLRDGGAGATAYADAVVTYLALGLSKSLDFNCTLAGWDSTNAKVRNTFARQTLSMTWDFVETNILGNAVGSFRSVLSSTIGAIVSLPTGVEGSTVQRDARARIDEVGNCVISTDPPYYDNVGYADLSDFFYVWLRQMLNDIWPDECATLLTPKSDELIADPGRAGSKKSAHEHFESGMQEVFTEAAKHADPGFPATIFYAFKATESADEGIISTGWETFLSGLLTAGFAITATWPMRTELGNRMRAFDSNALASSVVLACRPREVHASMATRGEFMAALRAEMAPAVHLLQLENIAPVDLAQSAIGPGIGIFSRYAKVVEADGKDMTLRVALGLINETLSEILSGEESEFDADTRFALTWFEQFGHNPGPFGDADLLARAKDTTVPGVCDAGIAISRDGRVRLLERSDLPKDWDPAHDTRLTVWETVQHLIRSVESSETEASALLSRLGGGLSDRARQLAYLLYGICDRKKWAEEAGAYNMLVMAWPEISRLAATTPPGSSQESLL